MNHHSSSVDSSPRERVTLRVAFAATCALVLFHFAATALYVMPHNPLRMALMTPLDGYMETFFSQGWELFAPDPIIRSTSLVVSCRLTSGEERGPFDATASLYEAKGHLRIAATRLFRAHHGGLTQANRKQSELDGAILALADSKNASAREAARLVQERMKAEAKASELTLARLASVECERLFPGEKFSHVQPALLRRDAPPFSRRNDPSAKGEEGLEPYGWMAFQKVRGY